VREFFIDVLIPAAFTALFLAGMMQVFRNRKRVSPVALDIVLSIGTTLCGVVMVVTVALTTWWNFFFTWSNFCPVRATESAASSARSCR
jgi:hypothetical protein